MLVNSLYKDHITYEVVRRKIQTAIWEYDELLSLVKKWNRRWFGHITRCTGLAKTVLQGSVKGKKGEEVDRMRGGKTIFNGVDKNGLW